jgi:membrane-bound serine protease (ClpP class)
MRRSSAASVLSIESLPAAQHKPESRQQGEFAQYREYPMQSQAKGRGLLMVRFLIAIVLTSLILVLPAHSASRAPVHMLYIQGQIDPVTADYVVEGIKRAENDAQAVLIKMDTPGGLLTSTDKIVQAMLASKVPVIVYVSPDGASAASAGAIVTLASNKAAMAPGSNIGSASPVGISSSGKSENSAEEKTMRRKVFNHLAAKARSIAEERGRNVAWAEKAVREAANLSASEALKMHVIDYISPSTQDLMKTLDGVKIKVGGGKTVVLHTKDAPLEEFPMGSWDTFLHYLSNPIVVMFLTMAAMYGIIYELANPGSIFPGVIGAISILLLLYSYSVIPVNAAGFAFIVLAIALFVIDVFTPTHGVLTVGGSVSLFFGLMMLFRASEGFMVPIWTLAVVTILTTLFFAFVISLGLRAMKRPYVAGREGVVGHSGEARTDLNPIGTVFADGALWTAMSVEGNIPKGEQVEVVEMIGLKLKVRRARASERTI